MCLRYDEFLLMVIKKCMVWQLRLCTNFYITKALHGVAGMIFCKTLMAQYFAENHARRGSMSSDFANALKYDFMSSINCRFIHFLIAKYSFLTHPTSFKISQELV
ncbi:hypothetical protein HMPREF0083_04750 [Aneurinibacillus aneurinilyticus ATCC 12856]|uniref:Uncharacterized protein n=1 Tax=Aneurinibacillus aneurinilyticus ATCC 12856 TaxID=649747 RepID=U1Y4T5_ANEAE|nr:hypothetical protein HMPREF0083_04750 [Aneurinibacillus aneurinilyticus ATCC 12856]